MASSLLPMMLLLSVFIPLRLFVGVTKYHLIQNQMRQAIGHISQAISHSPNALPLATHVRKRRHFVSRFQRMVHCLFLTKERLRHTKVQPTRMAVLIYAASSKRVKPTASPAICYIQRIFLISVDLSLSKPIHLPSHQTHYSPPPASYYLPSDSSAALPHASSTPPAPSKSHSCPTSASNHTTHHYPHYPRM